MSKSVDSLHDNPLIAEYIFGFLEARWPQLHRGSRIVYVDSFEVYIPRDVDVLEELDYLRRVYGLSAKAWRIAGEIFGRNDWWRKGMVLDVNPIISTRKETVRLQEFSGQHVYGYDKLRIWCGYHAGKDTLFIRK